MHKWQKDLWAGLTGTDPKKVNIIMNGRQIGKSTMSQMWTEVHALTDYYSIQDRATVDDEQWFTVRCSPSISKWVRQQNSKLWYEHIDKNWMVDKNVFDIHEKIHTMLQLKYSDARI